MNEHGKNFAFIILLNIIMFTATSCSSIASQDNLAKGNALCMVWPDNLISLKEREDFIDSLIDSDKIFKIEEDRDKDGVADLIRFYYNSSLIKTIDVSHKEPIEHHPLADINLKEITKIEYRNYDSVYFITTNDNEIAEIYDTIVRHSYTLTGENIEYFWNNEAIGGTISFGSGRHGCGLSLFVIKDDGVLMTITGHETSNYFGVLSPQNLDAYNDFLGKILVKIIESYERKHTVLLKERNGGQISSFRFLIKA